MLLLIFKFTTLLIPITAFGLAAFCILRSPKAKTMILWYLAQLAVGFWGLFHYLHLTSKTATQSFMNSIALHAAAIFIPIFFFHFVLDFLGLLGKPKLKWFLVSGYIAAIMLLIVLFNPPWLVSGVSPKLGFPFWLDAGPFYFLFVIYFFTYVLAAVILLVKAYYRFDGIIRKQIFFLLIASAIGFLGGGTNLLPQTLNIYPFGSFITFLYPFFIFYGVFLTEFKIIIRF